MKEFIYVVLVTVAAFGSVAFAANDDDLGIPSSSRAHYDEVGRQNLQNEAQRVRRTTNVVRALLEAKFGVTVEPKYTDQSGQFFVLGGGLGGCGYYRTPAGAALMCNGVIAVSAQTLRRAVGRDYSSL